MDMDVDMGRWIIMVIDYISTDTVIYEHNPTHQTINILLILLLLKLRRIMAQPIHKTPQTNPKLPQLNPLPIPFPIHALPHLHPSHPHPSPLIQILNLEYFEIADEKKQVPTINV